jgi:hypothetical protein
MILLLTRPLPVNTRDSSFYYRRRLHENNPCRTKICRSTNPSSATKAIQFSCPIDALRISSFSSESFSRIRDMYWKCITSNEHRYFTDEVDPMRASRRRDRAAGNLPHTHTVLARNYTVGRLLSVATLEKSCSHSGHIILMHAHSRDGLVRTSPSPLSAISSGLLLN